MRDQDSAALGDLELRLHFFAGRAGDRLCFDHQRELEPTGYAEAAFDFIEPAPEIVPGSHATGTVVPELDPCLLLLSLPHAAATVDSVASIATSHRPRLIRIPPLSGTGGKPKEDRKRPRSGQLNVR